MGKNDVEVLEYGGEIWINQKKTLKENLILQILLTELNIILHDLKKWDAEYKSVININLAKFLLKITMSSVKTQASILKSKFGVNQHDKFLCKK